MPPLLSVVVVSYDMARELPRTLHSLSPGYQRDIDVDDYEVVVVDNGTPGGLDPALGEHFDGNLRVERLVDAPPSPARAANVGIELATGALVGLVVDGARLASPGLLATALMGARVVDRPIVASLGWHLGAVRHMEAVDAGYDQAVEDALLAEARWEGDGYRLFEIATLAGSSGRGWFGPIGESSALFLPASLWDDLGGLDEAFDLPGGGLVNHDLYRRACETADTRLVMMLGEGTFHQYHGGAATSGRYSWEEMHAQYADLRGQAYRPPSNRPVYVGGLPPTAFGHLERSLELARARRSSAI